MARLVGGQILKQVSQTAIMAREFAVNAYLFIFRMLFCFFKIFPLKQKSTFVASFGVNIFYTAHALRHTKQDEAIVILKTPQCSVDFGQSSNQRTYPFGNINIIHLIRAIYHIATSRTIFVDNYYAFLAVTHFKPGARCVQLWHAAGAIKQFGLKDLSINRRPSSAYTRFKKVYQAFDQVVVGADRMGIIFQEGFGITEWQLLKTGVPRTDFFFRTNETLDAQAQFAQEYPMTKHKKVILYAPTYRDEAFHMFQLPLDVAKMYAALKDDYVLFIRVHPTVRLDATNHFPDFIVNVSEERHLNQLLVGADILVTDYSSIAFEFSLLAKPMIFFAYDLDEYAYARGFWELYEDVVPGPIVRTTDELINVVETGSFNWKRMESFARTWNQYSDGNASERLIETLYPENGK